MSELRPSFVFNGTPTITREHLKQTLRQAVDSSLPPTGPKRYGRVRVFLLRWEDDDIGVHEEFEALEQVFRSRYGYETLIEKIPSVIDPSSTLWLTKAMIRLTTGPDRVRVGNGREDMKVVISVQIRDDNAHTLQEMRTKLTTSRPAGVTDSGISFDIAWRSSSTTIIMTISLPIYYRHGQLPGM